ncbi:MAG: ABC transporter ATP-binding protein [Candidatus Hodarchaeales archaeon]|jgi:putative ABC transport system ATP-binding protein
MIAKKVLYHLEDVQRHYISKAEVVTAINGINLKIYKGEFVVILGPSGSGKTTLLNLLAGLDNPTGGKIQFVEHELHSLSDSDLCDLRRFKIGIIFQFYNMHPSFTALENVEYPMLIANISAKKRRDRAMELLKRINMYDKRDNYPAELSGGEKQRIGIARALANDPQVIIADEPTGDLDSENANEIVKILLGIREKGKTIIMVSHDESLLTEDMRILHLVDGKITPI